MMSADKPDLMMPKTDTGRDNLGIQYEGPVLSGLLGVRQQLQRQAVSSPQTSSQIREIAPGGAAYIPPEQFINPGKDPRLEPDPVLAYRRQELGNRPDLCDPVIRHHLNLPPLHDRYEELRRNAEHWARERSKHLIR
jgi:hypothetical protein